MRNVRHRDLPVPAAAAAVVLEEILDHDRSVWPARQWPALRLDQGLVPGSRGGHGPIRYALEEYVPGSHLRLRFDPSFGDGTHELRILPTGPGTCRLVHDLRARTRGVTALLWPLALRWLHEALIEDLFDRAEQRLTGQLSGGPARWSPWVRLVRWIAMRRHPGRLRPSPTG